MGIQLANLVLSTSDCRAGIDTNSETSRSIDATYLNTRTVLVSLAVAHWLTRFWFATRGQVARIPEETLGANARRSVVVGHAQGIRSTLNFATRIHTLSNSASEWEANLLVVALLVVCTLSENCAAVYHVFRIARVSGRTHTFAGITRCPWATLNTIAQVLAPSSVTGIAHRAVQLTAT